MADSPASEIPSSKEGSRTTQTGTPKATYIPAPHRLRIAAWVVDSLIIALIILTLPQPIRLLVPLLFLIFYHTFQIWMVQQTLGKALFALKVERIGKKRAPLRRNRGSSGYWRDAAWVTSSLTWSASAVS
jgi:hypothetical protein